LIIGSVDSIRLSLIEVLDSVFKQWEILEKAYTPAGGTQLSTLSAKFHSYKLRSGISVVEAASELSNIQTDIRFVDPEEAPTEYRKANKLMELFLASNDCYEPAVFMIQSKDRKADYTETVSVLSQVEEQINSSKSITTRVVDTAMATRMALRKPFYKGKQPFKTGNRYTNNDNLVQKCYKYNSKEHLRVQYPIWLKTPERSK
jgi:hypothetical protein